MKGMKVIMKIAIVEDNEFKEKQVKDFISLYHIKNLEIDVYKDVNSFCKMITDNKKQIKDFEQYKKTYYDLVITDLGLPLDYGCNNIEPYNGLLIIYRIDSCCGEDKDTLRWNPNHRVKVPIIVFSSTTVPVDSYKGYKAPILGQAHTPLELKDILDQNIEAILYDKDSLKNIYNVGKHI